MAAPAPHKSGFELGAGKANDLCSTKVAEDLAVMRKPRGAIAFDFGDRQHLAPYCCVLPVRSIAG